MQSAPKHQVFGIRHHGPGSARSLLQGLHEMEPDCVLIEGPSDAGELIKHAASESMKAPVAILVYAQDDLKEAVYYPFAVFSPEWQAIQYALAKQIPVRFIDLPQSQWLAIARARQSKVQAAQSPEPESKHEPESSHEPESGPESESSLESESSTEAESSPEPESSCSSLPDDESTKIRKDPLSLLAEAAGYDDSERWWENLVEHRRSSKDLFKAINEAMAALRSRLSITELPPDEYEVLREAHMRQCIRTAIKEKFAKIAVVCGAWHAPALSELPPAKADQEKLKGLPKIKVESTWIPWTYARLSAASGYGAGVLSPGWYHHLWTEQDQVLISWLCRVARLLRSEDLDASSAHIIETARLAQTLAAMRGLSLPGLSEISQASQAVLCFGNNGPMELIHEKLIIGQLIGEVPAELPGTPLQKDLEKTQKALRLPAAAEEKIYDLDLRNEFDLKRSHLLHRLEILNIPWGSKETATGKSGTFHEIWRLRWTPEFALKLIEASIWGKTLEEASNAFAASEAEKEQELAKLTALLNLVLLADLPAAAEQIIYRIETEAAVAADIKHLMAALPDLVQIARYGNVRKTNLESVEKILKGLSRRICAGLPSATRLLDENAAEEFFTMICKVHSAIILLEDLEQQALWLETLLLLANTDSCQALISGRACRLLHERKIFDTKEAARRFGLAVSRATLPQDAAAWADGFLRGSGQVLIHDQELFVVIDSWVSSLNENDFVEILPLLRRTFATYQAAERRQIGQRVVSKRKPDAAGKAGSQQAEVLDIERGNKILPAVARLMGLLLEQE